LQQAALAELLCDPMLCGDSRGAVSAPPELKVGAPEELSDVKVGQRWERGVVRNVAPFGLFVDVGVGADGLLHSSELRGRSGEMSVGSVIAVTAKSVDVERRRLQLALAAAPAGKKRAAAAEGGGDGEVKRSRH